MRYDKLATLRHKENKPAIDNGVCMIDDSIKHMACRQISFPQFCQIPFPDDVPQFIQGLFEFLTNESLRKFIVPIAKDLKVVRKLTE